MWAATNKTKLWEKSPTEPLDRISQCHVPQMLDMELKDLFAQLDFNLALVSVLLWFLPKLLPCGMEMFTPCHYILHKCNLLLIFAHI